MGNKSGPEADPRIGEAALETAQIGRDSLTWMQDQAKITNGWAAEDRARYKDVFEPMQDAFIDEANNWDSDARKSARVGEAQADVSQNIAMQRQQSRRSQAAMGVNPDSGRAAAAEAGTNVSAGLATAGAGNMARRSVENEAASKRAAAINMGSGMAVNPGTSMGMSTGAGQAGFNAAMSGVQGGGNILQTDYQNRVNQWETQQAGVNGLFGALGSVAGLTFGSSKDIKENKRPERSILEAIKKMPVERWNYKDGVEDGGEHVGPYAEDFQRETGLGSDKEIKVQDIVGVTLGAVKELADKVEEISEKVSGQPDNAQEERAEGGMRPRGRSINMRGMGGMPPPQSMQPQGTERGIMP